MAAKPTSIARWADVGGDIVEPNSGKKDVGWVADERPPAQYFNWIQNLGGQWQAYLDDGDLVGDHTIDGDLDLINSGNLNVAGDADVTGTLTAGSLALATLTLDNGGVVVTVSPPAGMGSYTITLPTALPSKKSAIRSDSSGNLTFENEFTIHMNPGPYVDPGDADWTAGTGSNIGRIGQTGSSGPNVKVGIPGLQEGWRMLGFTIYTFATTANSNTEVHLETRDKTNFFDSFSSVGSTSVENTHGSGNSTVSGSVVFGTPYVITAAEDFAFQVTATGAGSGGRWLSHIEIDMDYGA